MTTLQVVLVWFAIILCLATLVALWWSRTHQQQSAEARKVKATVPERFVIQTWQTEKMRGNTYSFGSAAVAFMWLGIVLEEIATGKLHSFSVSADEVAR